MQGNGFTVRALRPARASGSDMSESDESPVDEEAWFRDCRAGVAAYLGTQGIVHGAIGEEPAWYIAPVMSVWAIESIRAPGWLGWWVLYGDGPTDYISAAHIKSPQEAVRAIGRRWLEAGDFLALGEDPPDIRIGSPKSRRELAPLLRSRAELLLEWVEDESIWAEAAAGGSRKSS